MRKEQNGKGINMIGRNCRWNYVGRRIKSNIYKCSYTYKRCGLNHTCNCFNDKGKLCFQAKER